MPAPPVFCNHRARGTRLPGGWFNGSPCKATIPASEAQAYGLFTLVREGAHGAARFQYADARDGLKDILSRLVNRRKVTVAPPQDLGRQLWLVADQLHNPVQIRFGDAELAKQREHTVRRIRPRPGFSGVPAIGFAQGCHSNHIIGVDFNDLNY